MPPTRLSKKEQRDLRRIRRDEAHRRARQRRFRQNLLVVGGAVVVAGLILRLVALSIHRRHGSPTPSTTPTTPTTPVTGSPTASPSASVPVRTTAPRTLARTSATPRASSSPG